MGRTRVNGSRRGSSRGWGGGRPGAGAKPKGERAGVSHLPRAQLTRRASVHVTMRLKHGLPSLRRRDSKRVLRRAFDEGDDRFGLQILEQLVHADHLHLVVKADDRDALSRGLQGLFVRVAKGLNRAWERSGTVFADRYNDEVLPTRRAADAALERCSLFCAGTG